MRKAEMREEAGEGGKGVGERRRKWRGEEEGERWGEGVDAGGVWGSSLRLSG